MRVVLVHHAAPPVVGGVERVVGHHARLLAESGHHVVVVAGRGSVTGRRIEFRSEPLVDSLHPDVVEMTHALASGQVPASFGVVEARLVEELGPVVRAADVVIVHNVASLNRNLALTSALHRLSQEPGGPCFVLWHHDLASASPRYRSELHGGHPWDLLRTPWPGVRHVAISEQRRTELASLLGVPGSSIEVVPNGVDVDVLLALDHRTVALSRSIPLLDADPLLFMPARIVPRKNIELGLRVVSTLNGMGWPAGLVVTGPMDPHDSDGQDHLHALLALSDRLRIRERAWFPGAQSDRGLPDAVIADLYALADVLFVPSREEGFGIPVLEALLHRMPIVCSDLPALREVAGDTATYIDPDGDPAQVAARLMERLEGDPVSRAARSVRRNSSWQAIHDRWLAPMLERLARPPVPVP